MPLLAAIDFLRDKVTVASWRFGLTGIQPTIALQQKMTIRPEHPVPVYKNIDDIINDLQKLTWTPDPYAGRLDVAKHPTYMREAMMEHPYDSGDCEDYALYWTCALLKSELADEVCLGILQWHERNGAMAGHVVCTYRIGSAWFWTGNWNRCRPIKCAARQSFAWDMLPFRGKPVRDIIFGGTVDVDRIEPDDTVVLGKTKLIR